MFVKFRDEKLRDFIVPLSAYAESREKVVQVPIAMSSYSEPQ